MEKKTILEKTKEKEKKKAEKKRKKDEKSVFAKKKKSWVEATRACIAASSSIVQTQKKEKPQYKMQLASLGANSGSIFLSFSLSFVGTRCHLTTRFHQTAGKRSNGQE